MKATRSFKNRLVLLCMSAVLLSVGLAGYYTFSTADSVIRDQLTRNQQQHISTYIQTIKAQLNEFASLIHILRDLPPSQGIIRSEASGIDPLDGSTLDLWYDRYIRIFSEFAEEYPSVFQIRYIDEEGNERVNVRRFGTEIIRIADDDLQNKSDREYFRETMQYAYDNIYISPIELNKEFGQIEEPYRPTIRFATPVLSESDGSAQGIIVINADTKELFNKFITSFSSQDATPVIADENGYFLYNTNFESLYGFDLPEAGNFFEEEPELQERLQKQESAVVHDKESGNFRIWEKLYYAPEHHDRYWILFAVLNESAVLEPLESTKVIAGITVFLIGIIAMVGIYIIAGRLSTPLVELSHAIEHLRQGKGDIPHANRNDEIGVLARAFTNVLDTVNKTNSNLESHVRERTEKLQEALEKQQESQQATLNIMEDLQEAKQRIEEESRNAKKFQMAVENSADAVAIMDTELRYTYVNPTWQILTGYDKSEVMGETPEFLLSDETDMQTKQVMLEVASKDRTKEHVFKSEDIIFKRKDGTLYNAEQIIFPVEQNDTVLFYVALHRDITDRKRLEKAKSEFVSLASHQLRTPLTAIKWIIEAFAKGKVGKLSPQQEDLIGDAEKCAANMTETIATMLTISRIEAGRQTFDITDVSICDLFKEIHEMQKPLIAKRKHSVTISCNDPLHIQTDSGLLKEITGNLLSNAVKYTPEGGEIQLIAEKADDRHIVIRIKDNGLGIPKEDRDRIFTKFFRASNVVHKQTEGTGLGLYLVHSLVEMMGGSIVFESEENNGTEFIITLPLTPPSHE